jgi:hypothetical protein
VSRVTVPDFRPFKPNPGWVLVRPCGCLIDPVVFGHECREPPPAAAVFTSTSWLSRASY